MAVSETGPCGLQSLRLGHGGAPQGPARVILGRSITVERAPGDNENDGDVFKMLLWCAVVRTARGIIVEIVVILNCHHCCITST